MTYTAFHNALSRIPKCVVAHCGFSLCEEVIWNRSKIASRLHIVARRREQSQDLASFRHRVTRPLARIPNWCGVASEQIFPRAKSLRRPTDVILHVKSSLTWVTSRSGRRPLPLSCSFITCVRGGRDVVAGSVQWPLPGAFADSARPHSRDLRGRTE